jgi:MFS-type transporter involved in bile tolerance (Atg22 family)
MVGGFLVASRTKNVSAAVRVTWLTATYLISAVSLLPAIEIATWEFGVLLLILGTALAPALSANILLINKLVPEGRKAEAFGWSLMFIMLTTAMGQPVVGWILDVSSNSVAAAVCAVGTSLGALCASLASRKSTGIADPELSKA